MARYRIGNDITILWTVNDRDGKALPLQDKEVHLYYTCERGRFEADFEIQKTNTVVWNFYGGLQKTLGTYSLTLEILHPDSKSSIKKDVCSAFCLVGKDCEADAKETTVNGEISVYQEVITTNLDITRIQPIIPQVVRDENGIGYWYVDGVNTGDRATGETAYEYAKSKGYEGTEDQFAEKLAEFPDWNIADSSVGGYIKNRTHGITAEYVSVEGTLSELGFERGEYVSVLNFPKLNGRLEGEELYLNGFVYAPVVGEEYQVNYAGPSVYARMVAVENGFDVQIKGNIDTGDVIKIAFVDIRRIDDAYIPDTIQRVEDIDSSLSTTSENPVMNKVITEELNTLNESILENGEKISALDEKKADKEGNYPSLRVGTADTAIDLAGRGESVPAEFGFRASGGKSIKDGRAYIKRIKGNSVVWNQLYDRSGNTVTNNGMTSIKNADGSLSISGTLSQTYATLGTFTDNIENHTYLFMLMGSKTLDGKLFALLNRQVGAAISSGFAYFFHKNTDTSLQRQLGFSGFQVDEVVNDTFFVRQIDLTKMFQAGNEPTTIEDFNARVATLGVNINAYNEGEVIHCNTESIKSVGDNAWDGVLETAWKTSKIRCLSNEQYCLCGPYYNQGSHSVYFYDSEDNEISRRRYAINFFLYNKDRSIFTTPANCAYFVFEFNLNFPFSDNKDQIVISLYHSGWKAEKDNQYQPYWQDTLPLPIISNYFPDGMKSAGSAHDEIRYNKATQKWEAVQRFGSVDLGTFTYRQSATSGGGVRFRTTIEMKRVESASIVGNILCSQYDTVAADDTYRNIRGIAVETTDGISIFNADYTDAAALKADLQGVMLYYELETPIVTELDAEDQNFRDYYNVADFGTEMSQSSVPSAPFSADIIYQFNAVDMIREHELEITELQSIITEQQSVIATMQAQLASLTNDINDITI